MGTKRTNYTPTLKAEAVKMVLESSRPIAQVARELSMNRGRWARGWTGTVKIIPWRRRR